MFQIKQVIPEVRNETNENLRNIQLKDKDNLSSFYKKIFSLSKT